ncbi:phosphate/phosphite/phosphonate ABC transporter substrate-binding protein [Actinopolymorpha pittospori]|uniref:Phosphonate transport system substrate-binding protein n=1 Tax=Actinopolymorpha pittospori TaxID=648752 RepID=A0A927MSU6_9ACTN|nr:phosphate/phosphite/phosphonate ABC transporter substrate-binding protein [Actinopolymorpha pittospori]MBE1604213.1 phosphonate transport system substrate-binding protein [Actinopolymorpha pittospori]
MRVRRGFAVVLALPLVLTGCSSTGAVSDHTEATSGNSCSEPVRFGVEPYEATAQLLPAYDPLTKEFGSQVGCEVKLNIPTSYNAEIEAMRNDELEIGQFGPLGYILANKVADAEAVATFADADGKPSTYTASIVTPSTSNIKKLKDCRDQSFAYADPASTSGHLFPAYALKKAGIDPDKGVKGRYAGSHTASYEALRAGQVACGELNSEQIEAAKQAGQWKASAFRTLWQSEPIPVDPIAIRGDLPEKTKQKYVKTLLDLDLSKLPEKERSVLPSDHIVAQKDSAYDGIRDLVKTLNLDLTKING